MPVTVSSLYAYCEDHWRFKRVSNPHIEWEKRLQPLKPWCKILGEVIVGVLLLVGLLMAI